MVYFSLLQGESPSHLSLLLEEESLDYVGANPPSPGLVGGWDPIQISNRGEKRNLLFLRQIGSGLSMESIGAADR